MCELLALNYRRPIRPDFALRAFGPRSEKNKDGWGVGWYTDQSLSLVKEPVEWTVSRLTKFLEDDPHFRAALLLAHVREMSAGEAAHANTHPFQREWAGRDWCFAHNGTLKGPYRDLPLGRFRPVGQTDSEYLFCHLLDRIADRIDMLDTPESWAWLQDELRELNRLGHVNCLLSDGQRLFCYRDRERWKGLHFLMTREVDNRPIPGQGPNIGVLVASCPLFGSGWEPLEGGELLVVVGGGVVFPRTR